MPFFSQTLEAAIHHALQLASQRRHELATLEHLTLALTFEREAARALIACGVDLERLRVDLERFLNDDLSSLISSDAAVEAVPTAAFQRVIQRAAIHTQSRGATTVTGGNILVAVFAESESNSTHFLLSHGATRYDAVNFLMHGKASGANWEEQWKKAFETLEDDKEKTVNAGAEEERTETVSRVERMRITQRIASDKEALSLLARSLELQISLEISRINFSKPNFTNDRDAQEFASQIDFLQMLSDSLGALAEGIAGLDPSNTEDAALLAQSAQSLRDKVLLFLREHREGVSLYCGRLPVMLGSIGLFSMAGANMASATPILMAIFGGDKIVQLIKEVRK